jgi:hypothetical protein
MLISVTLAADNQTALTVTAQDAPRSIKQGRKLGTTHWW